MSLHRRLALRSKDIAHTPASTGEESGARRQAADRRWYFLRDLAPPVLVDLYRRLRGQGIRYAGPYATWTAAAADSQGYGAEGIVEKVRTATRAVVAGRAAAERDSVLLEKRPYPFPLIAVLLRAASERHGALTVLDFGGALGSSYYQCRGFLATVNPLRWHVVEQPEFVACGRAEFENDVVRFFDDIEAGVSDAPPDAVVLSGVLQYLPDPAAVLARLAQTGARYVVIDRTPVSTTGRQMIVVQIVPETISRSSYPSWLFDEALLKEPLLQLYECLADFDAVDGAIGSRPMSASFKGFIFRRRGPGSTGLA